MRKNRMKLTTKLKIGGGVAIAVSIIAIVISLFTKLIFIAVVASVLTLGGAYLLHKLL
jgi:hypothetical protein